MNHLQRAITHLMSNKNSFYKRVAYVNSNSFIVYKVLQYVCVDMFSE